jgi:hypothetical protein
MRRTWKYAAMTKDEGNDADGYFSSAYRSEPIAGTDIPE